MTHFNVSAWLFSLLWMISLAVSADYAPVPQAEPDPFGFCSRGSGDRAAIYSTANPDIPAAVQTALNQQDLMPEIRPGERLHLSWRCMNATVWVCLPGANIPCAEKADISSAARQPLIEFCQANPGAAAIPAYVTGRATVYAWACQDALPRIKRRVFSVDDDGYLAEFWFELLPPVAN